MTRTKTLLLALLALLALMFVVVVPLTGAPPVRAQSTPQTDADEVADSRATGFRAVDGAQVEDVPGGLMLVGAYGAIAVLLLLFLFRQQSQLGDLSTRIDALRREIERQRTEDDRA